MQLTRVEKMNTITLVCTLSLLFVGVSAQAQWWNNDPKLKAEIEAQKQSAAIESHEYLNNIGYKMLAQRAKTVAGIKTKRAASARQDTVRNKIIDLVGGLPKAAEPLAVKKYNVIREENFSIENIAYESTPGYWVTANVYVPNGQGPFPAIVIAPGHGAGKSRQYSWGANFATAGFVVLSLDAMGQGERLQHFDPELGTSKVERSGEHEHGNQTALLVGQHIARYWFADGIRGVDYLTLRKDVKANRIGTFGCSGGGTAAAYLAAMDPRIRAAAVSSYTTSFKELLPGNGPQDAEQTLPFFIQSGLDFADWIELAAPTPYAVIAFEDDFFPFAGANWTYNEARNFYSHFNAENNIEFIGGAGGHCNLKPVTPKLLSFLYKHLKEPGTTTPTFSELKPDDADMLAVMPSGQLSMSIGSKTVEDLAREEGKKLRQPSVVSTEKELQRLQKRVQNNVRAVAAVSATFKEIPEVLQTSKTQLDNYTLENVTLLSEPGIELNAIIGVPAQKGSRPVIMLMDALPNKRVAASADFIRLVKSGNIVVAFQPRDVLGSPQGNTNQLALGQYMPELLRAIVVGKTIVGMRVDDTLRTLNWLLSRTDVDPEAITLYGKAGLGMVALHAAAMDKRISKVVTESTLLSYQVALQAGLHKNLSEVVIPNVLRYYDVVDLLQAISPRPVSLVNPASAMGLTVTKAIARAELAVAFDTDRNLGTPARIQLLKRGFREPLPIK